MSANGERSDAIDALRGVALLGVLLVNVITDFRVSPFARFLPAQPASATDLILERILALGFESEPFILFSLLFGLGLAAQADGAAKSGRKFGRIALRRLTMLFAIGVVHLVFLWSGDVLILYAVCGIVITPLVRLPQRALLGLATLFFIVQLLPIRYPTPFPTLAAMQRHVTEAREVYGVGSFADIVRFRLRELGPVAALLVWSLPRTIALFFLGAYAFRARMFELARSEKCFAPVTLASLSCVICGGALVWMVDSKIALGLWHRVASAWGPILLSFGYGGAILVLHRVARIGSILNLCAPLGRMTLTNYLAQSVVFGFVFYGYGLGLYGLLDVATCCAIGLGVYVVQAALSAWWLRRFRFGPIEAAWRAFTYWVRPTIRTFRK